MKNKFFTLLLVVMASVGVANAEIYSGTCGDNLTWLLNTEDSVLTISGTGKMADYSSYFTAPWYSHSSNIKSIVINNGVTSISDYAFLYCQSLTSISTIFVRKMPSMPFWQMRGVWHGY